MTCMFAKSVTTNKVDHIEPQIKGGELSSQFRWFTIVKIEL